MILRSIVAAMAMLLASAAQACQPPALAGARTVADDQSGIVIAWRALPAQPKVGEFFVLEFSICDPTGTVSAEALRIDALMPAHRHGMNFQPTIAATSAGMFRAEGMMFHMPGAWQIVFERRSPSGTARLAAGLEIE